MTDVRGFGSLYATSVGLGLRHLLRRGYLREAVVRVVIPLDPSRYLELPWVLAHLQAAAGSRVLDLAGPKLLSLALARRGLAVTAVDRLAEEIDTWRRLTAGEPNLELLVADGRSLPFPAHSFDHAYSVSVLEHIPEPGDEQALRELARVVKPGGRVLVTVPYARSYREDWRRRPTYGHEGAVGGRFFFQRWYDRPRLERLAAAAPALELASLEVVRMQPNWNAVYVRSFPWLVPLGPLFGVLAREVTAADGDVARLAFLRR